MSEIKAILIAGILLGAFGALGATLGYYKGQKQQEITPEQQCIPTYSA